LPFTSDHQQRSSQGHRLLWFALIVTALAYLATLRFEFVYDDQPQIVLNPSITSWKMLPTLFLGHSWKFLMPDWAGNYYRPIFTAWLLVNRMLFGLNPLAWHATTVLLHVAATAMAFVAARQLLRDDTHAGFVALMFGLHPIHIESVAWISGVTDPLMAVFAFAAFWAWVKGEQQDQRRPWWRIVSAVFYVTACLSKESAILLPVVVIAYDFLFGRVEKNGKGAAVAAMRAWPLWIAGAAYMGVRSVMLRGLAHPMGRPLAHDLLTVPTILWGYMRRLVWPVNMSVFYDTPPVTSALQWRFWLPVLAWMLVGIIAWRISRRSRIVAISLIWIFAFLAPAIVGLPVFPLGEWVHDRYLYLPVFGFCVLVVHALAQLPSEHELFGMPSVPTAVVLLLTAVMALGTSWQEQYWVNGYVLFRHGEAIGPTPLSKTHLANELFRRGEVPQAEALFKEALLLDPRDWKNNVAYGLMLFYSGQFDKADHQLARAIALDSTDPNPHFYQGMSRFQQGNFAGAQRAFEQSIKAGPARSRYHFWLGFALEKQGMIKEAREQYETELQQHPDTDTQAKERLAALPGTKK
jgi:protein O-mannosyl-transferase